MPWPNKAIHRGRSLLKYALQKGREEVKRVRKLCCLHNLLDKFDTCGTCPLEGCDLEARKRAKQATVKILAI